jgi:alkylation response protein AidB-like acyl-CoA dehydrogenase
MDFDDTPEEAAYRARVREFLEANKDALAPGSVPTTPETIDRLRAHEATLYDGGYIAVSFPEEMGGQGGTAMQQALVDQEIGRAGLAGVPNSIGIGMCAPTVFAHGSDEQRARLPRLFRGDDMWCQLFSEPASGSDLAALRTTAVQESDGSWRINGQKVWTTGAQYADYGIVLTRTDPTLPKHRGLTMFIIDMHAPGVTVRPLKQMSGGSEFNEVYFDDVIIPDSERLGDVNDGWRVALTTLMNERVAVGGGGGGLGIDPDELVKFAATKLPELDEATAGRYRRDIGEVLVENLGTKFTGHRLLSKLSKGEKPGPEASAGKLAGTRAARRGTDIAVRLLGEDGLFAKTKDGSALWQISQASLPGLAIAGGTDEVLRNIIGERVLGLPGEPRTDKGAPVGGNR